MSMSAVRCLQRVVRHEGGGLSVVFAACIPVLLMSCGAAVDMVRWLDAKTRTKGALDAAVLAGARALQLDPSNSSNALAVAQSVYTQNVVKRLPLANDQVQFLLTADGKGVTAQGTAALQTTLLRVTGIQSLPLIGGAGAKFPVGTIGVGGMGGSNVEVAVALDVTGSMCDDGNGPCTSGNKLTGLKLAAKDLVNIVLQPSGSSKYTSRVALVPFSTRLRVAPNYGGGSLMKSLTNLNPTFSGWRHMCLVDNGVSGGSETGTPWQCLQYGDQYFANDPIKPCVTDRYYDVGNTPETTDDPPGPGKWLNAHGGDRAPVSTDSSDTPNQYNGQTAATASRDWNYQDGCADVDEANVIMPLSADKTALLSRIDGLSAYGSTSGPLATAMSWYMLSPKWGNVWASESTPGSYADVTNKQANGAPLLRKVAVIMTDGQFNTLRGWKDQDLVTTANIAKQLCTNMKAAGIEIYTVGLALDQLPAGDRAIATDTLQQCGSDVKHFYETLTVTDLQIAFREIALNLTSVRLSE